ncbi:MAG TPA: hypothetical protein VII71_03695 [Verrucomicrobiae bacterium]
MNNLTSPRYWRQYNALPPEIQKVADKNFLLFKTNPQHPSLRFERKKPELWSVRVGRGHRALARQLDNNLIWFWIGTHDEYERIIRNF